MKTVDFQDRHAERASVSEKIIAFLMALACVTVFGFWMKAMYDYDVAVQEYIEVIRELPPEEQGTHYDAIERSLNRLDPPKVPVVEHKARKKNDIIDDVVEMKMIGVL